MPLANRPGVTALMATVSSSCRRPTELMTGPPMSPGRASVSWTRCTPPQPFPVDGEGRDDFDRYAQLAPRLGGSLPRVGRRLPICGTGRKSPDWSRGRASAVFPMAGRPLETGAAIVVGYLAET